MDEYFDLKDEQMESVRPKVVSHLQWAQQYILPQLIVDLEQLKNLREPIRDQQFSQLYQKVVEIWVSIIDRTAEDGVWLFQTLSPQQFKHLQAELQDQHHERYEPAFSSKAEFADDWAEFQETRLNGFIDLVGEIREQQRFLFFQLLQESQLTLKQDSDLVSNNRKQFFLQTSAFTKQKELAVFFCRWAKKPSDAYQKFRLKRKQRVLLIFSELEKTLTEKQRKFRRAKIKVYLSDLRLIKKIRF